MLGNEGMERESNNSFCAPTPSAMVFGRSDGDRVAVTRDLALRPGYTLQFKVQHEICICRLDWLRFNNSF